MNSTVSVVIPTIGRESVFAAVESALSQTYLVKEVIVVVDADVEVSLPDDARVTIVHTGGGLGSSGARQLGIDHATGDVIGLLDDDDEWHVDKLFQQLAAVASSDVDLWIVGSRFEVTDESGTIATWPRRLIGAKDPVDAYIFQFHSLNFGGASLQTSTLCFPRKVAQHVRWSGAPGSVHDDPTWLMQVRDVFPDIPILQIDLPLVRYHLTSQSLSRTGRDESSDYIAWGREHLSGSDPRTRGDYMLTSPVTSAVAGGSVRGVLESIRTGFRFGNPGGWAILYAATGVVRSLVRSLSISTRKTENQEHRS